MDKKLKLGEFYTKNSIQTDLVKIIIFFFLLVMQASRSGTSMKASLQGFLTPFEMMFPFIYFHTCKVISYQYFSPSPKSRTLQIKYVTKAMIKITGR